MGYHSNLVGTEGGGGVRWGVKKYEDIYVQVLIAFNDWLIIEYILCYIVDLSKLIVIRLLNKLIRLWEGRGAKNMRISTTK